ncbi:MAG: nuclear transport factor 2 family protein [Rudaea sp.]
MRSLCFVLSFGLVAVSSSPLFATEASDGLTNALKRQADAWDVAIVKKDRAAISKNMAESFFQIDSDGDTANKAQFVDDLTSPDLTIEPYTVDEFKIRVYGNTALINGATDMHGTFKGKPFNSHYRFTDTYVKEGGVWRIVNVQTSRIKKN